MVKSALIFGVATFVLTLAIALISPVCGPCIAIFTGPGAGYLAGIFVRPIGMSAAAKSGAAAGALSAIGGVMGQMIGGVINAVFLGPEQAMAILRGLFKLPAGVGSRSPDAYYYLGALGIPCCVGLYDILLMAILGGVGGLLWYQTRRKDSRKNEAIASSH